MQFINSTLFAIRKFILTMPFSENHKGDVGNEFHPSHRMATFKRVITFASNKVIIHYHSKRKIFSATYIFDEVITMQVSMHGDTVYPSDVQIKISKAGCPLNSVYTESLNCLKTYIDGVNDFLQGSLFNKYLVTGMFYYTIPENASFSNESFSIK